MTNTNLQSQSQSFHTESDLSHTADSFGCNLNEVRHSDKKQMKSLVEFVLCD